MGLIVSIEPLKPEWISDIEESLGEKINIIPREDINSGKAVLAEAEVLICRDRDLTEEFLDWLTELKLIYIVSAGVEKLPFEYLKKRNIQVANTGGVSDAAMSDYAIGAILMFSSRFLDCIEYQRENYWKPYLMTESLQDKTLLIMGAGRIGKAVAAKARAFGMHIVGIKNTITEEPPFDVVDDMKSLNEHLREADYIFCTLPLTPETYHLFDENRFNSMKESAVFVNISRGKLVDEEGLIRALYNHQIRGAVLDVFEQEPLDKESRLWNFDNVVITPHSSGRIDEFLKYSMRVFEKNIAAYRQDGSLVSKVNLDRRY